MSASIVEVVAPSRLHFGLLSFGQPAGRQFGGAGAMIDAPALRLRISPGSERFAVAGPLAPRIRDVAERFARYHELTALPACHVEVIEAPPQHVGLGSGTQLAMAVAAGLATWRSGDWQASPDNLLELVAVAGRAARSGVGTYGFVLGGLIMESGKLASETLAPLEQRVDLAAEWRFVLVLPRHTPGLSGDEERQAFDQLPPVPPETTDRLRRELNDNLFPAARAKDFARFGESLYRYGHAAGECFAARQGGPFASPRLAALVETIRTLGIPGVGQSSWGPTIFAAVDSPSAAEDLIEKLRPHLNPQDTTIIARPNNTGAKIERR
jgi:beta-ribofuranosylaminobenzene 5'-phosphate synthase